MLPLLFICTLRLQTSISTSFVQDILFRCNGRIPLKLTGSESSCSLHRSKAMFRKPFSHPFSACGILCKASTFLLSFSLRLLCSIFKKTNIDGKKCQGRTPRRSYILNAPTINIMIKAVKSSHHGRLNICATINSTAQTRVIFRKNTTGLQAISLRSSSDIAFACS